MTREEQTKKIYEASQAFTPSSPVDDIDLFAGRQKEVQKIVGAIGQKGQHVVIFGERGVGKTSLTNVLSEILELIAPSDEYVIRVNADSSSTPASLWRSVLREVPLATARKKVGFSNEQEVQDETGTLADKIPDDVSPEEIRHLFQTLDSKFVIIFDELDRVKIKKTVASLSDTIKALSDHAVAVTLILVGVADSVEDLVQNHPSIERALVQIQMPRMTKAEGQELVTRGLKKFGMNIEDGALERIARLSQGLPHYTHLLALNAAKEAINADSDTIFISYVKTATMRAVEQAEQSIRKAYHAAVISSRGNLYPQVLLACALAEVDDLGFFKAGAVREPMKRITEKDYEIAAFARHLTDFCSKERGPILQKTGHRGRFRYRFINPTMQPYIIMKGLAEKMVEEEFWDLA
ncbi:MAG TPA: AAA family ATPase [Opitutaceae bacterium]|jgi:Cdc6-like AAA superfamily ATPase|nr:AAA family ATPase [Opitutaceae bacterium]